MLAPAMCKLVRDPQLVRDPRELQGSTFAPEILRTPEAQLKRAKADLPYGQNVLLESPSSLVPRGVVDECLVVRRVDIGRFLGT